MISTRLRDEFDLDVRLAARPPGVALAERELPTRNTCADTCPDTCADTCRETCARDCDTRGCLATGNCPIEQPVASRFCP